MEQKNIEQEADDFFDKQPHKTTKVSKSAVMDGCIWHYDGDEWCWHGTCGVAFSLNDGTPKDNNMNYCPRCGKKLIEKEVI